MNIAFVKPWVEVGKFGDNLVKELHRECSIDHPLHNKTVRAIAQRTDTDDVLFTIEGGDPPYAVVHLTWSGNEEIDPSCPDVKPFSSFNHWIRDGMIPDSQAFSG
jgi:hypothetical protein